MNSTIEQLKVSEMKWLKLQEIIDLHNSAIPDKDELGDSVEYETILHTVRQRVAVLMKSQLQIIADLGNIFTPEDKNSIPFEIMDGIDFSALLAKKFSQELASIESIPSESVQKVFNDIGDRIRKLGIPSKKIEDETRFSRIISQITPFITEKTVSPVVVESAVVASEPEAMEL